MNYKVKGIVTAIGEVGATKRGVAVQKLHIEQASGKMFYPQLLGTKIELTGDIMPGDVVEVDFHISGSQNAKYNNVVIDNLIRL